jgi:sirohydrochlorin cobaltochelatase
MAEDRDRFSDAALILAAHGSTLNAGSAAPAYQHGDALRRRRIFAEVTEAFVQQDPSLAGVLRRVFSQRVFIVPLFIAEGWVTEQAVPAQIGLCDSTGGFPRAQHRGGRHLFYCRPVGSHPAMTNVLEARAREVIAQHPFPVAPGPSSTCLAVVGHGTEYSSGSRKAVERQVELLRQQGEYAEVHGFFLDEAPQVSEVWQRAAVNNVVVVPFFISDGLHTLEDIPRMLGESPEAIGERLSAGCSPWRNPTERHDKRLWYAKAVGTEPLLAEVILERVREFA